MDKDLLLQNTCIELMMLSIGDGGSICFLLDVWCSKVTLKIVFLDFSPL